MWGAAGDAVCVERTSGAGIEVAPQEVEALGGGRSYVHHIPSEAIADVVKASDLKERIAEAAACGSA